MTGWAWPSKSWCVKIYLQFWQELFELLNICSTWHHLSKWHIFPLKLLAHLVSRVFKIRSIMFIYHMAFASTLFWKSAVLMYDMWQICIVSQVAKSNLWCIPYIYIQFRHPSNSVSSASRKSYPSQPLKTIEVNSWN